jgi:hypothetical protein
MRSHRLTTIACTLTALVGALCLAPPALASHTEIDFFEAPQQLIYGNAGAAVTQLQNLGVHAVRIQVIWYNVAPNKNAKRTPSVNLASPASYDWGQYAPVVRELRQLGWTVLLTVTGYAPCWASQCATTKYSDKELVTNPSAKDYGKFMEAVAKEFGPDGVNYYSVWNEPNQPQYLLPQYANGKPSSTLVAAQTYRKLYLAAYAGIQASGYSSGVKVLLGETSPVGESSVDISSPLAFMRGVLCLNSNYVKASSCGMLHTAGYAQHPYDSAQGPFWVPPAGDVTIGTLGRLQTALARAAAAGAIPRGTPIYITEFGVQSYPNTLLGVPAQQQAEYDAIAERTAWDDADVRSFDQYLLSDDPDPGEGSFQTGLEYVKGQPKPIYNGYRLPLSVDVANGSSVSFWGLVRPATAATTVTLQYSANSGKTWHTLQTFTTNANGYWSGRGRFVAKRQWRVEWTAANGTVYTGASTRAYAPGNGKPQT